MTATDRPAPPVVAVRPRVTAVVVAYNAPVWTQRCLEALALRAGSPAGVELDVVVVDNASSELTVDDLTRWAGPSATVVGLPENIGFGRACNRGVAESGAADPTRAEYVLLVNPDAIIEESTPDALVAFHDARPGVGIVGGRITKPDGTLDPASCWGSQTLWSLLCFATGLSTLRPGSAVFNPEGMGSWPRDTAREVGVVTGCLSLIERPLWDRLGGFDERFFMYGEDADLCARARGLGYASWITPTARAVHATGASSPTRASKLMLVMRGKATLARDLGPTGRIGVALLAIGVGVRAAGERVRRRPGMWSEGWRRRSEWLGGYSAVPDRTEA